MARDDESNAATGTPIGQIPLRKMSRAELEGHKKATGVTNGNPMNRLVPYLDLFGRLDDAELSRLTGATEQTTAQLRTQVNAVCNALARYVDLLPRLADPELMRLTGASAKTIRFWRLCQPRVKATAAPAATPRPVEEPRAQGTGDYAAASASGHFARGTAGGAQPTPPPSESTETVVRAASAGESSGVRTLGNRPTPTPAATPSGSPPPAANPSELGLSGAPFPGYDYVPGEGEVPGDDDEEGIVIGLDLPDTGF